MNRKGFTVNQMLPLGLAIVVLGIGLALGADVLGDFKADQTTNSNAYNATGEAEQGINKFATKLPTIATVIVTAVILGILVKYLFFR